LGNVTRILQLHRRRRWELSLCGVRNHFFLVLALTHAPTTLFRLTNTFVSKMSTLLPADLNNGNAAFGIMVAVTFLLHQIPIFLSIDKSKHPKEDAFITEAERTPFDESSAGHRWSLIANNNAQNLWQGVLVFLVSKTCVERGIGLLNVSDNVGMYKFLTAMMWLFTICRVLHTLFYKLGINGPVPVRSLSFGIGNLAVWSAAVLIPIALSNWKYATA